MASVAIRSPSTCALSDTSHKTAMVTIRVATMSRPEPSRKSSLPVCIALFQITRCAQNRLPREQPALAPSSEPTAITLRSPYCLANVPRTPTHTPAVPPRPHPTHSLPSTRKNVTFPRHPFPALPHPTPHTPHFIPTSAPFLPTNPPPIPQFRHALEDDAQTCYPRQREGQTPRPANPTPNTV